MRKNVVDEIIEEIRVVHALVDNIIVAVHALEQIRNGRGRTHAHLENDVRYRLTDAVAVNVNECSLPQFHCSLRCHTLTLLNAAYCTHDSFSSWARILIANVSKYLDAKGITTLRHRSQFGHARKYAVLSHEVKSSICMIACEKIFPFSHEQYKLT